MNAKKTSNTSNSQCVISSDSKAGNFSSSVNVNRHTLGEIKVPAHLISSLLRAVSEPPFVNSQAIDTAMLIQALPEY